MRLDNEEYLAHYGILRKSGRYPWGSGETPNQRSKSFLDITKELRKQGMTDSEIAKSFSTREHPFTSADLRALRSRATTYQTQEKIRTAQKLQDKGMGPSAIARQMNLNESTVRSLLEPGRLDKLSVLQSTADMLKRQVEEKGFVDVGAYVEKDLPIGAVNIGISPDKFKTALSMLKEEGYPVHPVHIPQAGTGELTRYKVLCKPGVTKQEAFANRNNIRLITEKSDDNGHTFRGDLGIQPPLNISSKRVDVRYKEDGGADADGVIFVRPGVKDVELGKSRYAQVRVAIDNSHFLKGMAVYKDDLPAGIDLQFNTNKSNTGNKLDALKPLKRDKEGEVDKGNPFGAMIKDGGQILDSKGKVSSAMNIVNEEGDWDTWSKTLSRQVLAKQSPELIKSQLDFTYERQRAELEQIKNLTNPQVKRRLLESFGDETDSKAVHLKAAEMPRQATKVILPSNHVKPTEVFAPTFDNGERVALLRFPHAGRFEIPVLTVNNKSREARKLFGGKADAPDAIAIHPKVAEHLSGADFDGDHVVVIPNNRGHIIHDPVLENLKGFDPQMYQVPKGPKTKEYPDGKPIITPSQKQNEMGQVSNLITDMTIRAASSEELGRAVRHSMVVIDSEKHNLDYKASERDHGILQLKREYQGVHPKTGQPRGASTLISRATAQTHVQTRKAADAGPGLTRIAKSTVDNKTGEKVWTLKDEHTVRYRNPDGTKNSKSFQSRDLAEAFVRDHAPNGKIEVRRFKSKQLAETTNAYELVSEGKGTRVEQLYADHSNRLKSLANEARREWVGTQPTPYNKSAKEQYSHEVDSLNAKLERAQKNAPLERQAQVVAARIYTQRKRANPNMDAAEQRKIKAQALAEARLRTGAKKHQLGSKESPITDREWEAIQAGAISNDKMEKILRNADLDVIRERATPRVNPVMTPVLTSRAKQLLSAGYTLAEVSDHLNVPLSTLKSSVGGGE